MAQPRLFAVLVTLHLILFQHVAGKEQDSSAALSTCGAALESFTSGCGRAIAFTGGAHGQGYTHGSSRTAAQLADLCKDTRCVAAIQSVMDACDETLDSPLARLGFGKIVKTANELQDKCRVITKARKGNKSLPSKLSTDRPEQPEEGLLPSLPPLIVVPALTASALVADIHRESAVNSLCKREGTEQVWPVDAKAMFQSPYGLGLVPCWIEEFSITVDVPKSKAENKEVLIESQGVHVHPKQEGGYYGDTSEGGLWGWEELVYRLADYGYQQGKNVYGTPYDWRHGPSHWNLHSWPNMKANVEGWVAKHQGRPAIFVADSMGGPYFAAFLLHAKGVDQEWKRKHVGGFLISSPPLNGVHAALGMWLWGTPNPVTGHAHTGYPMHIPGPPRMLRELLLGFGSLAWLLPRQGLTWRPWATGKVLVKLPPAWKANLTAEDIPWLLRAQGKEGAAVLYELAQLFPTLDHPGVKVFCMFGTDLPTYGVFTYNEKPAGVTVPFEWPGKMGSNINKGLRAKAAMEDLLPKEAQTFLGDLSNGVAAAVVGKVAQGSLDPAPVAPPPGSTPGDSRWKASVAQLLGRRNPDVVELIKGDGLVGGESLAVCERWRHAPGLPDVEVQRNRRVRHSDEKHSDVDMERAAAFVLQAASVKQKVHKPTRTCSVPRPGSTENPSPVLAYTGREFEGSEDDFEDLGGTYHDGFCGALSIAFKARWDDLAEWSRIIDFSSGPMQSNIIIANKEHSSTLLFAILNGPRLSDFRAVEATDIITIGEEHQYLCTVTDSGRMRIYVDGKMVSENPHGHAPPVADRRHLYVAKSAWKENGMFSGRITELRVWNAAISVEALYGRQGSETKSMTAKAKGDMDDKEYEEYLRETWTTKTKAPSTPTLAERATLPGPVVRYGVLAATIGTLATVILVVLLCFKCSPFRKGRRSHFGLTTEAIVDVPLCETNYSAFEEEDPAAPCQGLLLTSVP